MQEENHQYKERLEAFSRRLSVLAGRKRLRQVEIARRLSTAGKPVSAQRVGSWFQARNFPGGDVEYALAALLGVQRDWLIEGKETPETKAGESAAAGEMQVNPPDYRISGSPSASVASEAKPRSTGVQPDPRFQSREEPTPQMCEAHFAEFLARAETAPGGIGFTWRLLQKHFPLDEFEPKEKDGPRSPN